jgi:hypothetical protein
MVSVKAQRGGRGIALHFLDLGARRGWVVSNSTMPRPLYPGKDPVPIIQEAGWAAGPVWMCAKNLAPTGIQSLVHPAHSQSLYQLSYPGPNGHSGMCKVKFKSEEEEAITLRCLLSTHSVHISVEVLVVSTASLCISKHV